MKKDFNLSKELIEVLKRSSEFSKSKNLGSIGINVITFKIFELYLSDEKVEDSELKEIIINGVRDKDDFLSGILELESNNVEFEMPDEYKSIDLIFSKEVIEIFNATKIKKDLIEGKGSSINCLDILSLLTVTNGSSNSLKLRDYLHSNLSNASEIFELSVIRLSKGKNGILDELYNGTSPIDIANGLLSTLKNESNNDNTNDDNQESSSNLYSDEEFEKAGESEAISGTKFNPDSKTPYLDQFSFPMSTAAKYGKYDKVVGRDKEISQIIEILCCRKKNNAVLLGDPGCGKTAVVEGLVQKINNGEVPKELINKKVYSLDLNALVSGTKYRGEYEQRLQEIIKEVCSNPDVIIYIDEFHNLVGNGGSAGNGDGANILKPYLARGEFQCIGSTTVDEYRKFIEKDGALKRRFQNVMIEEPNIDETINILTNISEHYSKYHKVRYPENVIKCCVEWSGRYVTDRFFPDKAIDCLDMAGSLTKLQKNDDTSSVDELNIEIEDIQRKKIEAIENLDFDKAGKLKIKENSLIKKLDKLVSDNEKKENNPKNWPEVTLESVANVISKISNVPVDKINQTEPEKLREMKKTLENKVIGQEEAVKNITLSLQRNFLGLRDENKPIATMLFVGPTGTGKSLICKEMAKEFFGSEKSLIRFDMGEFGESHEVTKLTGSTASYVGYEDSPLLEQVRRNPYSVVLFDEIEKAAPEIYNIFLNILDEGSVTLGNGTKVDFKNTIIVFTGNIGTKELILRGDGLGFGSKDLERKKKDTYDTVMKAVKKQFKPEFINRLSSITVFNELTKENMHSIFDLEINKLSIRLKKNGYNLEVTEKLKEKIVSSCDIKYGARDLQREITKYVENEICNSMLDLKSISGIETIKADLGKDSSVKISFIKRKRKSSSKESIIDKKEPNDDETNISTNEENTRIEETTL